MASLILSLADGSEQEIALTHEVCRIGRNAENDIVIDDDSASSFHAEVHFDNGRHILRDLGSTNGVRVNGERIQECPLSDSDLLRFGGVRARYTGAPETSDIAAANVLAPEASAPAAASATSAAATTQNPAPASAAVRASVSGIELIGFGPKKSERDLESTIYMALSGVVVLTALGSIVLSFTMK